VRGIKARRDAGIMGVRDGHATDGPWSWVVVGFWRRSADSELGTLASSVSPMSPLNSLSSVFRCPVPVEGDPVVLLIEVPTGTAAMA
jgi:hypothetical protein